MISMKENLLAKMDAKDKMENEKIEFLVDQSVDIKQEIFQIKKQLETSLKEFSETVPKIQE